MKNKHNLKERTILEKAIDSYGLIITVCLIGIGFLIMIFSALSSPFNDWSFSRDPSLFSQYGEFIGGLIGSIFSLASFFLLYKTFIEQKNTLMEQKNTLITQNSNFQLERTDNLYFNLLEAQRDIGRNIKAYFADYNDKTDDKNLFVSAASQDFFLYSKAELSKIWNSLNSEYVSQYDSDMQQEADRRKSEIYDEASSGLMSTDDANDEELKVDITLKASYTNKFYNISQKHWTEIHDAGIIDKMKASYNIFFKKYHYATGHYFRHMYHILLFIEQTETSLTKSSDNQKPAKEISKKYIDFLQSQMSSYELMLLFYDSLLFPKMQRLVIKYNFLENLAIEDLIDNSHDCVEGIQLKKRSSFVD